MRYFWLSVCFAPPPHSDCCNGSDGPGGAVILFGINGLGDLLTLLSGRDVVKGGAGVLAASLFLFGLMIPATRWHFDVRDPGH